MIRRLAGRILVIVAAVCFGLQPFTAYAATGLSVGPFIQEVDLAKGQKSASFTVTVGNGSAYTLPIQATIVDFGAADDHGGVDFLSASDNLVHKYGLASWMTTDKSSFLLQPHSAQQIKVTIDNRDSLGPGGHYGAVIFQLDKSLVSNENDSQVSFIKAVSTLVLAKKEDGAKESVNYTGMSYDHVPFGLPSTVDTKLYNNGNVHSTPTGTITVTNTFGQVVSKDPFNNDYSIILPSTERVFPTNISNTPIQWIPGWATVTLHYKLDDSTTYQTITKRFFVFSPWSIVVLIALVIIILLGIRFRTNIRNIGRRLRGKPLILPKIDDEKIVKK